MITLSQIAKEAHVSVSTASKAFSGSPEVSDVTRQIVFEVARRHGCFKRFFNAKYSKYVIAIICPEFGSLHYATYLSFLRQALEQDGCEVCVAESNFSPEKEQALLDYYGKYADVDGIILINPVSHISGPYEIPLLCLGKSAAGSDCTAIICNMSQALDASVHYLIANSIRSIGFVGETLTERKLAYFKEALARRGLSLDEKHIQITPLRFENGGYQAMEKLLSGPSVPRAVVCAYDDMAMGAMRCIADHGLKIPEDIMILGMDDIPHAKYLIPPLASINSQAEECCRKAAKTIIGQINGQDVPPLQEVTAVFHQRESFRVP